MDLSAEECRAQVAVQVDDVESDIQFLRIHFIDVAPKVFLQIRHAAGVSSREYADVLGAVEHIFCFFFLRQKSDAVQVAPTFIWIWTKKICWLKNSLRAAVVRFSIIRKTGTFVSCIVSVVVFHLL